MLTSVRLAGSKKLRRHGFKVWYFVSVAGLFVSHVLPWHRYIAEAFGSRIYTYRVNCA